VDTNTAKVDMGFPSFSLLVNEAAVLSGERKQQNGSRVSRVQKS
jgi:hypothetical protein